MEKKIKVIIWDLDGTIFYSPETAVSIHRELVKICSVSTGKSIKESRVIFEKMSEKHRWTRAAALITNKKEIDVVLELENKVKRHRFASYNPALLSVFKKLNSYKHLILTNSTTSNTVKVLLKLGFMNLPRELKTFESIFAADTQKVIKPNTKIFKNVLKFTGLKPDEHLMVGDFDEMDILPASKLGIDTHGIGERARSANTWSQTIFEVPQYLKNRRVKRLLNIFR